MLERKTIKGREATVAYLTEDMHPTTEDQADLVKILFDDGEMLMLRPAGKGGVLSKRAMADRNPDAPSRKDDPPGEA